MASLVAPAPAPTPAPTTPGGSATGPAGEPGRSVLTETDGAEPEAEVTAPPPPSGGPVPTGADRTSEPKGGNGPIDAVPPDVVAPAAAVEAIGGAENWFPAVDVEAGAAETAPVGAALVAGGVEFTGGANGGGAPPKAAPNPCEKPDDTGGAAGGGTTPAFPGDRFAPGERPGGTPPILDNADVSGIFTPDSPLLAELNGELPPPLPPPTGIGSDGSNP